MNLLYLGAYKRINNNSTVAASLTYFSLGEIQMTDAEGQSRGTMNPNEFAFDLTYAMKLNEELSLGASGRLINSDLTNGQQVSDGSGYVSTKPATSVAADLGIYWQHPIDKTQELAAGAFFSNMGAKLSYSDDDTKKEFLPTNLRIGTRYTNHIDASNSISLLLDLNKLLVPTPPVTVGDSTYSKYYRNMTEYYNTGVMRGAIQSFYDAPGGFSEELREIQISVGGEYWYKQTLAARVGYFYESATKGGRQYITFGVCDFAATELPPGPGTIFMNPEYGERMGERDALVPLYKRIGAWYADHPDWNGCLTDGMSASFPSLSVLLTRISISKKRDALRSTLVLSSAATCCPACSRHVS